MDSILFQPMSIGGMEVRNRFIRSATAEGLADADGGPTKKLEEMYCDLSRGGVGLIITSGAFAEAWHKSPAGLGFSSLLSMHGDAFVEKWRPVIEAVHADGAKIAIQLGHLGRQDIPEMRGSDPMAPSAVPIEGIGHAIREMTHDEIAGVIESLARAARRARKAGFDAIQFHGAHGNLVTNFMSPFTNRRTDQYGGSRRNRARFAVELLERTRGMLGPDYPLMIKLSFSDFVDGGLSGRDAVEMAAMMAQAGLDCIEVSGGTLSESRNRIAVKNILQPEQEAYFEPFARALKARVSIPVALVGGLRSLGVMERIIDNGGADFISMSRPLIREPGLINRWQGNDAAKAKCISCNQCFDYWIVRPTRCYVENPPNESER